ncbi:unnamed protein product [Vicia faba]|uniref:Uncharacterized protein n=1 Tax=Vicia faba TaxID=3906 RepID=A0AAV0ZA99_VICFA|nr:unnamed protein product [Vicia faba]
MKSSPSLNRRLSLKLNLSLHLIPRFNLLASPPSLLLHCCAINGDLIPLSSLRLRQPPFCYRLILHQNHTENPKLRSLRIGRSSSSAFSTVEIRIGKP